MQTSYCYVVMLLCCYVVFFLYLSLPTLLRHVAFYGVKHDDVLYLFGQSLVAVGALEEALAVLHHIDTLVLVRLAPREFLLQICKVVLDGHIVSALLELVVKPLTPIALRLENDRPRVQFPRGGVPCTGVPVYVQNVLVQYHIGSFNAAWCNNVGLVHLVTHKVFALRNINVATVDEIEHRPAVSTSIHYRGDLW